MIEFPSAANSSGDDDDSGDSGGQKQEPASLGEQIKQDSRLLAIFIEASKLVGATHVANILSEVTGKQIGPDSNIFKKGSAVLKAQYESISSDAQHADTIAAAKKFVTEKVLELQPYALWGALPETRLFVVHLLRHKKQPTPNQIAPALTRYMRVLGMPLKQDISAAQLSTLIKKKGREEFAEELSETNLPRRPALPELTGPVLKQYQTMVDNCLDLTLALQFKRGEFWKNPKACALMANMINVEGVSDQAVVDAVKKNYGEDMALGAIQYIRGLDDGVSTLTLVAGQLSDQEREEVSRLAEAEMVAYKERRRQELAQMGANLAKAAAEHHQELKVPEWMLEPASSRAVALLLLRKTDASPADIAAVINLHRIGKLRLPNNDEIERRLIVNLFLRVDREALADDIERRPGGGSVSPDTTEDYVNELLQRARRERFERSQWLKNKDARALVAALLEKKDVPGSLIIWAAQEYCGERIAPAPLYSRIAKDRKKFIQDLLTGVDSAVVAKMQAVTEEAIRGYEYRREQESWLQNPEAKALAFAFLDKFPNIPKNMITWGIEHFCGEKVTMFALYFWEKIGREEFKRILRTNVDERVLEKMQNVADGIVHDYINQLDRSPWLQDKKARLLVAAMLGAKRTPHGAITWAVKKYCNKDVGGLAYQVSVRGREEFIRYLRVGIDDATLSDEVNTLAKNVFEEYRKTLSPQKKIKKQMPKKDPRADEPSLEYRAQQFQRNIIEVNRSSRAWLQNDESRSLVVALLDQAGTDAERIAAVPALIELRSNMTVRVPTKLFMSDVAAAGGITAYARLVENKVENKSTIIEAKRREAITDSNVTQLIESKKITDSEGLTDGQLRAWHKMRDSLNDARRIELAALIQKDEISLEYVSNKVITEVNDGKEVAEAFRQIIVGGGSRLGLADFLLVGVSESAARSKKTTLIPEGSMQPAGVFNAMIADRLEGIHINEKPLAQKIQNYFQSRLVAKENVSQILDSAITHSDAFMTDLALSQSVKDYMNFMDELGSAQIYRLGYEVYGLSPESIDVIFMLKGLTMRGARTIVLRGERQSRQGVDIDAPVGEEGSSTLGDLMGEDDPGYQAAEARLVLRDILNSGILSAEDVEILERITSGEASEITDAEYAHLANVVRTNPDLAVMLGIQNIPNIDGDEDE